MYEETIVNIFDMWCTHQRILGPFNARAGHFICLPRYRKCSNSLTRKGWMSWMWRFYLLAITEERAFGEKLFSRGKDNKLWGSNILLLRVGENNEA